MSNAIRIMRRRISNKKWLTKRLNQLLDESHHWHTFEKFECSTFFKGYEKAAHNLKLYQKGSRRTSRQIKFIQSLLNTKQP